MIRKAYEVDPVVCPNWLTLPGPWSAQYVFSNAFKSGFIP